MIALLTAWRFLKSPIGRVVLAGLGMVAIVGLAMAGLQSMRSNAYGEGQMAERGLWEARLEASERSARAKEASDANAGQRVGKAVAVETVRIEYRTKTLIERIPYDVPPDPAGWSLPLGFVRHHIESTTGDAAPADPAARAADAPSGLSLAELAEVDDRNAGILGACRVQVTGWQDWWRSVGSAK